jgi:DNA gyrase subunit A
MGRATAGVTGTKLEEGDEVVGMAVVDKETILLSVTENGYGKRSSIEDYRMTARGTKGVINIKTTERNGQVVSILDVKESDQLMMITKNGMIIRCPVDQIRVMGRATQGVRLIGLDEGDRVVDVAHLAIEDEAQ